MRQELPRLHEYLLEPLGTSSAPASIAEAVRAYAVGRANGEELLNVVMSPTLENAIVPVLAEHGLLEDADDEEEERC